MAIADRRYPRALTLGLAVSEFCRRPAELISGIDVATVDVNLELIHTVSCQGETTMTKITATNQETKEIRTYKITSRSATITTSTGDRRETTPEAATAESAKLEWPWIKR